MDLKKQILLWEIGAPFKNAQSILNQDAGWRTSILIDLYNIIVVYEEPRMKREKN